MLDDVWILNAQVPDCEGLQQICIQKGFICEIVSQAVQLQRNLPALDVSGDWISLGGIDLQINGALGLAFPDLSDENSDKLEAICQFLWSQGVDGFLPTIVTTSIEKIQRSLSTISRFLKSSTLDRQNTSKILGVHLEGPFLNFEKRGAHPAEYLLPLSVEQIKRVLGDYASVVKVITLAPELDPTRATIAYLRSLGILVSLGHSQATATQAQQAFAQGATLVTHAFNVMPSLHHREPGLLGAAIVDPNVHCGLIADGQHVSPLMLELVLKASQFCNIFLVSDALSPLGLPDDTYPWDTRQINVRNGTARLHDKTLAGTTLPLLVGAQNLVKWGVCGVEQAIALATTAPRRAIAEPTYLNQPAHLLRWHLNSTTDDLSWQRL